MFLQKMLELTKSLEDAKYPLLGPNIRGLFWCGLWQFSNKFHKSAYIVIHFISVVFVISLYIEFYVMREDTMTILFNISIPLLSLVSISKTLFLIWNKSYWKKLVTNISEEEIKEIESNDNKIIKIINDYTMYSRVLTYGYWLIVFLTNMITILAPFLKYITASHYRAMVQNGTEPYPQIMLSYFPFDNSRMPGYLVGIIIHIIMSSQGAAEICFYDSTAVSIMSFLKGYLMILKVKCERIFGEEAPVTKSRVLMNIRECHRMHNFFIEQYEIFNSLLSPVMFIYVLVCSITICCSVVQLSLEGITFSQKFWVVEFATALSFQLFLYCWHSNEILYESMYLSQGVFNSNWWRADVQMKKELLLLAGKLSPSFILHAGPFSTFSMSTYIEIMKGSYSFYTLFTQMQES
ncbi:odorant receptor Or2-like [Aricia agestis]|uniref:odorant receptor Or2-like n=1 Tax=Aricia agestis TaxID=91739 RepID=UPI001C20645C|nr:odorant receptor Or2-like [Aricia agestis]